MQEDALVAPVEELKVPAVQSATREAKSEKDCVNRVRSDVRGGQGGLKFKIRVS